MKPFLIGTHKAWGWTVCHMGLAAGGSYGALIARAAPRDSLPSRAMWTKGRVTGVNLQTGAPVLERVRGVFSGDLPPMVAGRYRLEAAEDAEWWCIPNHLNGFDLPGVQPLRRASGEVFQAPVGTRLLVISGAAETWRGQVLPGGLIDTTGAATSTTVEAVTEVLGLLFNGART